MLINLWALVVFGTVEWSVSPAVDGSRDRRTAPRYLLPGGGSNPSPVRKLTDTLSPRGRVALEQGLRRVTP